MTMIRRVVRMTFLALSAALLALACEPVKPITTASGTRIGGVEYVEAFARSDQVPETTFHGDRLRRAVQLMDKHGLFALAGVYEARGVLDSSTLFLTFKTTDDRETKIVLKNCNHPKVCAFFEDAAKERVVERLPLVCRSTSTCSR